MASPLPLYPFLLIILLAIMIYFNVIFYETYKGNNGKIKIEILCMCVYVHVHMYVCVHVHVCVCIVEFSLKCLPHSFNRFLTKPRAHRFT